MIVTTIGERTFPLFEYILTDEAKDRLAPGPGRKEDTFGLGVLDPDGFPMGAIAVKCYPPTAEVISLYVMEPLRRMGVGSQLMFEAVTSVMTLPGIDELIVPYSERPGKDELTSFFQGIGMDIIDVGADYKIKAADALSSSKLKYKRRQKALAEPWDNLKTGAKKMLFNEGAGLKDYYEQGKLRMDLVYAAMGEGYKSLRGCIAMAEEGDELILAWLRAENSPILMMELLNCVLQRISENGEQDKMIRIPTINPASDAMVQDLFGKKLEVEYYSKRVVFDFEEE